MTALNNPCREAFARGLAEDLSPLGAYAISGYKGKSKDATTTANRMATPGMRFA